MGGTNLPIEFRARSSIMKCAVAVLAVVAAVDAFQAPAVLPPSSKLSFSRLTSEQISMQESSDKAVVIGAAAVGGIAGVYLFHELSAGLLLAGALAYSATLSNEFGSSVKNVGGAANKAYNKVVEVNEQYDLLPKTKTALDTVTTAAGNLNENYGITKQIDEKLKLTATAKELTAKVDEVKGSVSTKFTDLESKADAPAAKSE